jgi:hypothetical protein
MFSQPTSATFTVLEAQKEEEKYKTAIFIFNSFKVMIKLFSFTGAWN